MMSEESTIFAEFLGQPIKAPYIDGPQIKVARGILEAADGSFVKIRGSLGVIIINTKNIEKMSLDEKQL